MTEAQLFQVDLPQLYQEYRRGVDHYYMIGGERDLHYFSMVRAIGVWRFGVALWDLEQQRYFRNRTKAAELRPRKANAILTLKDLGLE